MAVYYGDMRVASDASEMYGFTMPCAKKAEDNDFYKKNRFASVQALSSDRALTAMDGASIVVTDGDGSVNVPYSELAEDIADRTKADGVMLLSCKTDLSSDISAGLADKVTSGKAVEEYVRYALVRSGSFVPENYYVKTETSSAWELSGTMLSFLKRIDLLLMQVESMRDCFHPMADGVFTTNVEGVDMTFRKNGQELYFGSGSSGQAIPYTTTQVTIPPYLSGYPITKISEYALKSSTTMPYNCRIVSVEIPPTVTDIGTDAFYYCDKLKLVVLPESLSSIGRNAFYLNRALLSVKIPDGVKSVEGFTFRGCSKLSNVVLHKDISSIGQNAFNECSSLTSIVIPDGVVNIDPGAFYRCSSLTGITIPDGVPKIKSSAFKFCVGLAEANIGSGVSSIEDDAFGHAERLPEITIPGGVKNIGSWAFRNCYSLSVLYFEGDAPTTGRDVFQGVPANCTAYVRADASGWPEEIPGEWNGISIDYWEDQGN